MTFSQNVHILDLHSLSLLAVDPDACGVDRCFKTLVRVSFKVQLKNKGLSVSLF